MNKKLSITILIICILIFHFLLSPILMRIYATYFGGFQKMQEYFTQVAKENSYKLLNTSSNIRLICGTNETCIINQTIEFSKIIPWRFDTGSEINLYPEIMTTGGDCEDHAILIKSVLDNLGIENYITIREFIESPDYSFLNPEFHIWVSVGTTDCDDEEKTSFFNDKYYCDIKDYSVIKDAILIRHNNYYQIINKTI